MADTTPARFTTELNSFFALTLLNMVFGALSMAFGLQYLIAQVLGIPLWQIQPGLRAFAAAIAMIGLGLGLAWVLTSARVFRGIQAIHRESRNAPSPVPADLVTEWIIRMLAHYRDNRRTIGIMIIVCTVGGVCFFLLGIITSLESLSVSPAGISFTLNNSLVIPAMLLTLGIAFASLLSSYYFSRFTRVWDRRLRELAESECTLKKTLGLDEA